MRLESLTLRWEAQAFVMCQLYQTMELPTTNRFIQKAVNTTGEPFIVLVQEVKEARFLTPLTVLTPLLPPQDVP